MSIERLNKAASAAGFAMATPDDEQITEARPVEKLDVTASRAVMISGNSPRVTTAESLNRVTDWVKSHLPGVGWRAPA